ncbi:MULTISPECIES: hypothetical protein [Flavobacteriaceae]|uniref:hypothetical protein n=1 Tax=Flavobacteriaceae TaxID=49546 RepID=UPI001490E0F7|nr:MULTISPECIES: hypothetical protein [Allomuricauda]MDC6366107.1 hypothetical protein [Muricauda sp. AC10]
MINKSKNVKQSIHKGLSTNHVFTDNGTVFIRSAQTLENDEWSAINFHWIPVLKLERELGA